MEEKNNKLVSIMKFVIYFVVYAIIGWIYETVLEVWIYKTGFTNRGFLFGPYLPVYGFGALVFILCLRNLKKKNNGIWKIISPILVFIGIVLISTTMELVTSYILEKFTGGWLWDYNSYAFNFEGRIALNPSIRFGIGGMAFMYLIQPLLEKMTNKMNNKVNNIIASVILIVLGIDLIIKIV